MGPLPSTLGLTPFKRVPLFRHPSAVNRCGYMVSYLSAFPLSGHVNGSTIEEGGVVQSGSLLRYKTYFGWPGHRSSIAPLAELRSQALPRPPKSKLPVTRI